ncbi:MAG: 6-hydroxymethylpterin diphosphokinase MptE-like protein [Anaerolineaceae bacterium]|nr:6-hydroxymethylpterin diphosphokinase MptE-like protein [Anaerolineaceae bacterium]
MAETKCYKEISPLGKFARQVYDGLRRIPELPEATLHPWRRESVRRLKALKNSHQGERCFVVGNGPSLKVTDLSKLQGEFSIGFNRIFLAAEELGFTPSCLVSINDLVIEQSVKEFSQAALPKFFAWRARKWLGMDENTHFLYTTYTGPKFSKDVCGRVWEGATVTNVGLQLAYHMGFSQVYLIGVDHNFVDKGKPNTTVESSGADQNHFSGAYFGKGFRWQLPDLEVSEQGYRMARKVYEETGREVYDATIGGKLQVFKKINYHELF